MLLPPAQLPDLGRRPNRALGALAPALLPLPARQRNAKPWRLAAVRAMADASTGRSTGAKMAEPVGHRLSSSIVELASTLTRYNQEIAERTAEKERMGKILAEFRKHIAWQGQRKQLMRRNQERLFNESSWLEGKTAEVLVARPSHLATA